MKLSYLFDRKLPQITYFNYINFNQIIDNKYIKHLYYPRINTLIMNLTIIIKRIIIKYYKILKEIAVGVMMTLIFNHPSVHHQASRSLLVCVGRLLVQCCACS